MFGSPFVEAMVHRYPKVVLRPRDVKLSASPHMLGTNDKPEKIRDRLWISAARCGISSSTCGGNGRNSGPHPLQIPPAWVLRARWDIGAAALLIADNSTQVEALIDMGKRLDNRTTRLLPREPASEGRLRDEGAGRNQSGFSLPRFLNQ
jgi:hypothetical protein